MEILKWIVSPLWIPIIIVGFFFDGVGGILVDLGAFIGNVDLNKEYDNG